MQESVNSDAPLTRLHAFRKKISRYHTGSNLLLDYNCFVNTYFLFYPMVRLPLGGPSPHHFSRFRDHTL